MMIRMGLISYHLGDGFIPKLLMEEMSRNIILMKHEFVVNIQHYVDCMLYYYQHEKEQVQSSNQEPDHSAFYKIRIIYASLCIFLLSESLSHPNSR